MKKALLKILTVCLSLCLLATSLFACGGTGWKPEDVTLKNGGEVKSINGFIAETDEYLYFINGQGDNTKDNAYGAPVKGSLMALDKDDYTKTCIVVPQLFVASDYNAGLFISDGYVYYGTPCTDLDSSGKPANGKMTFAKTKLDGTDTTKFFTVGALSNEYRMVEDKDGDVHIVYYDTENSQLVDYNTVSKESLVIAKTDEEAESVSLGGYRFAQNAGLHGAVVFYTVSVYTADFNEKEKEEEGDSYARETANYNKLYAYALGDEKEGECAGVLVFDGNKTVPKTYALDGTYGEYVAITESDTTGYGTAKKMIATTEVAHATNPETTVITNTTVDLTTAYMVTPEEVYYIDGEYVMTTRLYDGQTDAEKVQFATKAVAKQATTLGNIVALAGDYAYYVSTEGPLARIKIKNVDVNEENDVNEQVVSGGTVSTTWYKPAVVDGKIFYLDNSAAGASYVHYTELDGEIKTETDDNDEITKRYLESAVIGKMTDEDIAVVAGAKIDLITSALDGGKVVLDAKKDGKATMTEIKTAREFLDGLTDAQRNLVSADSVKLLKKYEKAVELSIAMNKLEGFEKLSDADKDAKKSDYEAVKTLLTEIASSADYELSEVRALTAENCNWYYKNADKYFNA